MKTTCKNCGHTFKGNFCNNCGQEANIKKLDLRFIISDVQQGMFSLDRGILYTLKQLCTQPGHSIREFIEGKRVNYTQPVSFVIILATVYGILYYYFKIDLPSVIRNKNSVSGSINLSRINEYISLHYAWFTLATIPFLGISSYLIFKKQAYTFFEHLVLNAYLAGQRIFMNIALFPLLLILYDKPVIKTYVWFVQLFDILLIVWGYTQFFNKRRKTLTVFLSIISYFISFLFLLFAEVIAVLFYEVLKGKL